jgi:hypothetical protein
MNRTQLRHKSAYDARDTRPRFEGEPRMMVAVRITLDRRRPCLACGAPWRVRATAPVAADAKGPTPWDERGGQCSARCWERDPSRYLTGVGERVGRGWDADDTSRCLQFA